MPDYIGRETIIEAEGKSYRLARFDRDLLSKFTDWAQDQLPNPFAALKDHIKDFPRELQEVAIREAVKASRRKLTLNSPELQEIMATPRGAVKLLYLLLHKHQAELTDQEAERIFDKVIEEKGEDYLAKKMQEVQGSFPEKAV